MNVIQKDWPWTIPLSYRTETNYIIVHHTDGPQEQDVDAIEQEHLAEGWSGIGYTEVIKGDGTVVQGRPDDAICAAALGLNYCSLNISLEGDFQSTESSEKPTDAQIDSLKQRLTYYLSRYSQAKIIGHRDVAGIVGDSNDATACPGDVLYAMLPDIIKAVS
jgi:hypothetical protein